MGTVSRLWLGLVEAGSVREPRTARRSTVLGKRLAGAVLIGHPAPRDGGAGLFAAFVSDDGAGVTVIRADLPSHEAARALASRLLLRAGPASGMLANAAAEAAFMTEAMLEGMAIRHVAAGSPDSLARYAAGGAPDLSALPVPEPMAPFHECHDGGAWMRVLTLAGAQALAAAGLAAAAARYAWDVATPFEPGAAPAHYVLVMPGGAVPAWVRLPGPEADPFEIPEVAGPAGRDPFDDHAGRIADLGRAADAMIGPRHCLPLRYAAVPARRPRRRGPA